MNVYLILSLQMFFASGTYLIAKPVANDIEPFALTMLRNLIATSGLLILFFLRERRIKIAREDRPRIFLLGFLAICVNQFSFLVAIRYTTPANAALLYASTPIAVMMISYFMKKEQLTRGKVLGVVLAFLGIVIVIFERGVNFGFEYTIGNIILLVSVVAYSLYTVLCRPLVIKYGSLHVTALSFAAGTLLFLPAGVLGLLYFDFSRITMMHVYGLLYLGLFTSIVSNILWNFALSRIEATKVAIFSNGQPIITTIFAVIIFHQVMTAQFIVGGIITISGVIVTQQSDKFATLAGKMRKH